MSLHAEKPRLWFATGAPEADWRDAAIAVCLGFAPLFFLTVRGWTNAIFFVLVVLCVSHWRGWLAGCRAVKTDRRAAAIVLALSSGVVAVLISQLLRNDFVLREFDGPSRMLLGAVVFLVASARRIDAMRVLQYTLPLSLLIAALYSAWFPVYRNERLSTYFVDPITYGNYTLIIGMMCLFSVNAFRKDSYLAASLKLGGFAAGLLLSLQSQTRSGWLAGFALLLLWLASYRREPRQYLRAMIGALAVAAVVLCYTFVDFFNERVNRALADVPAWFSGENPDTAIGYRLTMLQIGLVLFARSPLYGYGDLGYIPYLDEDADIMALASEQARLTMHSGPHNELLAAMLQAGVFGLASALSLFLVPMLVFFSASKSTCQDVRSTSLLGLCLVVGLFICSFSEQVFYLKFASSFYALMIAVLSAIIVGSQQSTAVPIPHAR
jgi:O-antigen ligase